MSQASTDAAALRAIEKQRKARERREKRLIRDFRPPEGVVIHFSVAGLGSRFAAQMLDIVITLLFILAVVVLLWSLDVMDGPGLTAIAALLFFFIRAPYYVLFEILWNGQTLGKRITRLRVISADGRSLRPYAVVVRNLMKEMEIFVPGTMLFAIQNISFFEALVLLIWITVLLIVPLTNRRRQRLGDMIAGTCVIEQPSAVLMPDLTQRSGTAAATEDRFTFLPHQLDHYGAFELQTLERVLQINRADRQRSMEKLHQQNVAAIVEKVRNKIEWTDRIASEDYEAFLHSFYRAQRKYLETRQLFGDARADKYYQMDEK